MNEWWDNHVAVDDGTRDRTNTDLAPTTATAPTPTPIIASTPCDGPVPSVRHSACLDPCGAEGIGIGADYSIVALEEGGGAAA